MSRAMMRWAARKITLFAAVTMLGASSSWATPFTGPTSPYYLDNYDDQTIYVVRGTSVINSFPWAQGTPCENFCEGTLAVTNVVSTNRLEGTTSQTAGRYTLGGTPTGTKWTVTPPLAGEASNAIYDGTSDGTHNYTIEWGGTDANVIQTDLNWQNPVSLFTVHAEGYMGITYDPTNDSLWLGGWGINDIADYSLTGTLLSSFATLYFPSFDDPYLYKEALAFDPTDDTLWFSYHQGNLLFQYSTSGTLLQSGTPSGLPSCCYFSGEFAEPRRGPAPVPTPDTLPLFATGLGLMALLAWRRAAKAARATP